jgi:hypothetical protein
LKGVTGEAVASTLLLIGEEILRFNEEFVV